MLQMQQNQPSHKPALVWLVRCNPNTPTLQELATFTHSVRTRANTAKFAYQSLCNSKISSLMKAMRHGFLKGCHNLTPELVTKYLSPSPATAKGHMKQPTQGIRSTREKEKQRVIVWVLHQQQYNKWNQSSYQFYWAPTLSRTSVWSKT